MTNRNHGSANTLVIPPLVSGGIILSYQCTNRCRHCLYGCAPDRPHEWMTVEFARQLFANLASEHRLAGVHLAGGEAFLNFERLLEIVKIACEYGVRIDYVETNGYWASQPDLARDRLQQLKSAGLDALLVSVSPFHAEYIPLSTTLRAISLGMEVFGRGGVLVWQAHWIDILQQLSADQRIPFETFLEAIPRDQWSRIPGGYSLTAGGRVPYALASLYAKQPATDFANYRCRGRLQETTHFHIDLYGNFVPQLCAGIVAANIDRLHEPYDFALTPFLRKMYCSTLGETMQWVMSEHGYTPDPAGYCSPCHLCVDLRRYLKMETELSCPELAPDEFYTAL